MLQDGYHNLAAEKALDAQTLGADGTVTGDAIDLKGFQQVTWFLPIGAYTDGEHQLTVEESDDGVAFTQVADDFILDSGSKALVDDVAADGTVAQVGYNGVKEFARLAVVSTGVTTGVTVDQAVAVLGEPLTAPVEGTAPAGETD